jgi:hypothetical protein
MANLDDWLSAIDHSAGCCPLGVAASKNTICCVFLLIGLVRRPLLRYKSVSV